MSPSRSIACAHSDSGGAGTETVNHMALLAVSMRPGATVS
jgi:hypothetical protein